MVYIYAYTHADVLDHCHYVFFFWCFYSRTSKVLSLKKKARKQLWFGTEEKLLRKEVRDSGLEAQELDCLAFDPTSSLY